MASTLGWSAPDRPDLLPWIPRNTTPSLPQRLVYELAEFARAKYSTKAEDLIYEQR